MGWAIGMTTGAALPPGIGRGVKTAALAQGRRQLLVAGETLSVHRLLAVTVAGNAVAGAFQRLVRARQRPRGDLGHDARREEQREREHQPETPGAVHTYQNQVAPIATTTPTWIRTAARPAIANGRWATCQ